MKFLKKLILIFISSSSVLFSNIINVPADIDSIQGGIDLAVNGDTILVADGTYYENINFKGKSITVASQFMIDGNAAHIDSTIINGSQPVNPDSGTVVYFVSGEDSTSVLSGFKICNGSGTVIWEQTHGGGIFCNNNSSPILMNLIVSKNVANTANGAGIACENNSNPKLLNVLITENNGLGNATTGDGSGGIYLYVSSPVFKNVSIVNNTGVIAGGICFWADCNPLFINVTIAGNEAQDGAELVLNNSNPIFINSIIWNKNLKIIDINSPDFNSITLLHSDLIGGIDSLLAHFVITNWLAGNINSDPMFVDTANGNYSLQAGSPCIDAGIQDTVIIYNNGLDTIIVPPMAFNGSAPDMGTYEFGPPLGITEETNNPKTYSLDQNYPNPFNPTTTIEFSIPKSEFVKLKIYNMLGQVVATLVSEKLTQGNYKYGWDASDFASGVYIYQLQTANGMLFTKKLLFIK